MSEQTINDHVLPSGLTFGQEKRRARLVAMLHGYDAYEENATEESLKAEYEALTGEAYRSREEEQADNLEAAKERRQLRIGKQFDSDRQIISDAKANGFQDCLAIRNALGWDKPAPNGSYYNAMQTAYRWIVDAGEEVVYLIPDGRTDIPKSQPNRLLPGRLRPMCWPTRTRYYAKREALTNGRFNMAQLQEARALEGSKTDLMDWDDGYPSDGG